MWKMEMINNTEPVIVISVVIVFVCFSMGGETGLGSHKLGGWLRKPGGGSKGGLSHRGV